ncbi:sulfate adenylyltransferase subunit CysN [Ferrimonas pelagia]|uniref:Sulfate adenylyltransferase subunit 1 n=1 Tax=Ferrimonas pelagia TaxID=1177826 RepID=A0ABP9EFS1_9GAMM
MNAENTLIEQDILAYLQQHEDKELLRFITCGSVDDGKSTLIGRLLHDSKMIFEDQLAAIESDSKKVGTTGERVDLALLVDGLQSEREQGITIDVAYRYFSTDKRKFIIADTPGHEQYTRNMATGASTADLAIILIDARHGVQVQTRRHSYLVSLLGIKQVVVAINKMDLVDFSEARFDEIRAEYAELAAQLGLANLHFVPLSALEGDNVVNLSSNTPWYDGQALMSLLESVAIIEDSSTLGLRLPVQHVSRPDLNFRGFAGTLASGQLQPGQSVMALPSGKTSTVKSIVTFDGEQAHAQAGDAVTVTLNDEIDLSRGEMLVSPEQQPSQSARLSATLVWMADEPMQPGREYGIKLATQSVNGWIDRVTERVDVNTFERSGAEQLALNEIGMVELSVAKPLLFDRYQDNRTTGAFIVIDKISNVTVAAGIVQGALDATLERASEQRYSAFELELNALVRKHFPHWHSRDISLDSLTGSKDSDGQPA